MVSLLGIPILFLARVPSEEYATISPKHQTLKMDDTVSAPVRNDINDNQTSSSLHNTAAQSNKIVEGRFLGCLGLLN